MPSYLVVMDETEEAQTALRYAARRAARTGGAVELLALIEPQEFVRLAYSSASLQAQAARLAAGRDTRPEIKDYAASAADFRASLLQRLEAFARERSIPLPARKEFEHQVIIENLEPLDALELSRRYAEIQVQALDREIGIYQAANRSPHQEIKEFATQVLPELQQRLKDAQTMYDAIKP